VVIPKEIRRSMRIKEGDPLELYTTHEGEIVFKKYQAYDEKDWIMARKIVQAVLKADFAIYDSDGNCVAKIGTAPAVDCDAIDIVPNVYYIGTQWDTYGYLYTKDSNWGVAVDVLKAFLERE
jgi:AbrB family looped-hinge helix DNA binding protein